MDVRKILNSEVQIQPLQRYSMAVKFRLLFVILALLLLHACQVSNPEPAQTTQTPTAQTAEAVVSGTVTYRQKIALPPDAVVRIEIIDASERVRDFVVVAEQTIKNPGAVPIKFQLRYAPEKIDPNHQYRLLARIEDASGKALFTSSKAYPVISKGSASSLEVIVDQTR